MGKRSSAREIALRALFQVDVAGAPPDEALAVASSDNPYRENVLEAAREFLSGTVEHRPRLDELIERHARGWTLSRMAIIDRNVLRLAVFELLYHQDVHPSVVLAEAVELAKKYSTAESGRFVNGVLGSLVRGLSGEPQESQEPAEE